MNRLEIVMLFLAFTCGQALSQSGSSDLKIFGYFQNSFVHQSNFFDQPQQNSFSVQQLNLFFQKDLAKNWRGFVNFEFLNNFSSSRQWGAANLEEAWARYRANEKFNLKLGLLLPIFNHLNDIKNRTPLLPYVIRPLVYETSFNEFVAVDEFTPGRAFVQAYGFVPFGSKKFEYAVYIGNSPNITTDPERGQTGIDSTDTILVGGRIGIRAGELKIGFSATNDRSSLLQGIEPFVGEPENKFKEISRTRIGGDLSYHFRKFSFESEFILVRYDDDSPNVKINKEFYYATLGYYLSEQWFIYASYWLTREDITAVANEEIPPVFVTGVSEITVPTIGVAYRLNDRVTLKAQFAPVDQDAETDPGAPIKLGGSDEFNHYSIAASIFF